MALLLEAAVLPLSLGLACEESLTVSSMLMELSLLPGQPCVPTCRERRPVTVSPFPCRMQRLPARGLRAACSESWSVEPKEVQQGQVNSRHASRFKRRFWFTASCLCSRYLCLPGALRGTFHTLEIMTDPNL